MMPRIALRIGPLWMPWGMAMGLGLAAAGLAGDSAVGRSGDAVAAKSPGWELVAEWRPGGLPPGVGPGEVVDVNLGHGLEEQVAALWFQLTGQEATASDQAAWLDRARAHPGWRRIDLAVAMAEALGKGPRYVYSDPWRRQIRRLDAPARRVRREAGAVCMFFFNCPDGAVNGRMSWANNHAPGMDRPSAICRMRPADHGHYDAKTNPGFWFMELLDARHAGLQFLLLNTYGPDLREGGIENLVLALAEIERLGLAEPVRVGLFDDTWTWGQPWFGAFWRQRPDMADPEACARLLFEAKWRPFFAAIPRRHWYLFRGRPLIYFYNGGPIQGKEKSAPVFRELKRLFREAFGVEPFLCVDLAFNGPGTDAVADGLFQWYSLGRPASAASITLRGVTLAHAMVRWDATARDNGQRERLVQPGDRIHKDDRLLRELLDETRDVDLLVLATWNDLGEGTGINRCYDYHWAGQWRVPTHFMELVRQSQEGMSVSCPDGDRH